MIDLYTVATGNGHRAGIMMEESGLPYKAHKYSMQGTEHKTEEYRKINPTQTMPAIVDHDVPGGKPVVVGQSSAILLYLAEKSGKLLPKDPVARGRTYQWLMFAMTDVATMSTGYFYAGTIEGGAPAKALFEQRLKHFLEIADKALGETKFLAGDEFTIADVALYPVFFGRKALIEGWGGLANLRRWADTVAARPGVIAGLKVAV